MQLSDFKKFIDDTLNSFKNDPADSDHQEGYEAAFRDMKEEMDRE